MTQKEFDLLQQSIRDLLMEIDEIENSDIHERVRNAASTLIACINEHKEATNV